MIEFTSKEIDEKDSVSTDPIYNERIATIGSYEIYIDKIDYELKIRIADRHPGALVISRQGLEKLLRALDF